MEQYKKSCEKCSNKFFVNRTKKSDGSWRIPKLEAKLCKSCRSVRKILHWKKKSICNSCKTEIEIDARASSITKCDNCRKISRKNTSRENIKRWIAKTTNKFCNVCKKPLRKESKSGLCKIHGSSSFGGKNSAKAQSEFRRSKNEKLFADLCIDHFGKEVLTNKSMFNGWDADVIIPSKNVAVLWNGKWHYEKITKSHSVEQVQNRDRIKIQEIKNAGYVPYIVEDRGRHNVLFVNEKFQEFLAIFK